MSVEKLSTSGISYNSALVTGRMACYIIGKEENIGKVGAVKWIAGFGGTALSNGSVD